jgi:hypothetical protein
MLDNGAALKVGAPVRGHTLEPFYVDNQLAIPLNSSVDGTVVRVVPAPRSRQIEAYTHGDFTPLKQATLHFFRAIDQTGYVIPLVTADAELATSTVRLEKKAVKKGSMFRRLWNQGTNQARDYTRNITEPGRMLRAREFVYGQLPYHPQSLLSGTEFDLPFLALPRVEKMPPTPTQSDGARSSEGLVSRPVVHELPKVTFILYSRLVTPLSSAKVRKGDTVVATVVRPVIAADGQPIVPQGTLIRGAVLETKPARSFGRAGSLRFSFAEIVSPSGVAQRITGVPHAINSDPGRGQILDQEGGVEPKSTRTILVPVVLGALATHSIRSDDSPRTNAAIASNGFGLITRVVATCIGSNVLGGVIGGVATARAVYTRFVAHGRNVEFPAYTPMEIELNTEEAPVLPTPPQQTEPKL